MEKLVGGLPDDLIPGAPVAYACFGTWENASTCIRIDEAEDPFDGCSQSVECRRYTLESNPPTTRFSVKPRRDGRFEIQQFRDFIGTHSTYQLDIEEGEISITFPGDRSVPKSRRFFLHVKHVEEAKLSLEQEFELVMTLEKMILHQASDKPVEEAVAVQPRGQEDAETRRKRIAERLKNRASEAASSVDIDDDLDFDIDLDDLEDEPVVETVPSETSETTDTVATTEDAKAADEEFIDIDDFEDVDVSEDLVPDSDLDEEDRIPQEEDELDEDEEGEEGEGEEAKDADAPKKKKGKKAEKDAPAKKKKTSAKAEAKEKPAKKAKAKKAKASDAKAEAKKKTSKTKKKK